MPTKLKTFSVRNTHRGTILATRAKLASSYWSRFWGLMFRRRLSEGDGILLTKSSSIHSFFMFFRFDAIYLDRDDHVVKVVHAMRPWWASFGGKGAKDTLELPAGTAERTGTVVGDTLAFEEAVVDPAAG
jgi:uncharacterized membrane protein (UPF0127 family)